MVEGRGARKMTATGIVPQKANSYGAGDAQLYETTPELVWAMIAADPWLQQKGRLMMDGACGPGAITCELQRAGHKVLSSDLFQYEARWKGVRGDLVQRPTWNFDFFNWLPSVVNPMVPDATNFAIMMNPAYGTGKRGDPSLAARFVAHALELAPRVYMLLRSDFVHAGANCPWRDDLIDTARLTGVFPFRERVNLHRDGFTGKKQNGFFNYSWFRWEREGGPRTYQRVSLLNGGHVCPIKDARAFSPVHRANGAGDQLIAPAARIAKSEVRS